MSQQQQLESLRYSLVFELRDNALSVVEEFNEAEMAGIDELRRMSESISAPTVFFQTRA